MIGAIVGDIAGSRFEFRNNKSRDFDLFVECRPLSEMKEESLEDALGIMADTSTFTDDISIGGDSDTIGAICGAVAGAFYGVPDDIHAKAETFLDANLLKTLHDFEKMF